jgi:hypothetical protein
MNARLVAVGTICGFALAALVVSPGHSAPGGAPHGLFEGLKVGQIVELNSDGMGAIIRTYDDPESRQGVTFLAKISEIGTDYIALEYEGKDPGAERVEYRLPIYAFSAIQHVGKGGPKRPAAPGKKKN